MPRTSTRHHLPRTYPAPTPHLRARTHPSPSYPPRTPRRRSVATFEAELGVRAPERLRACAGRLLEACEAGTMLEASEWLANATSSWRAA